MIIRTTDFVSDRTLDGRVYSAGEGAVTIVDEADAGMVEMFERLAKQGLVEVVEDSPAEVDEPPPAEAPDDVDEEPPPAKPKRAGTARGRAAAGE